MPAPHSSEQVRKASQNFWTPAGGALLILVAIHVAPKEIGEQNIRLVMTVTYFASLVAILWAMGKPHDASLKDAYGWKYREGGPALEQHARLYLSALNRLVTALTTVAAFFVGCIAFKVLSHWLFTGPMPDEMVFVSSLVGYAWWLALIALLSFPFWGR